MPVAMTDTRRLVPEGGGAFRGLTFCGFECCSLHEAARNLLAMGLPAVLPEWRLRWLHLPRE